MNDLREDIWASFAHQLKMRVLLDSADLGLLPGSILFGASLPLKVSICLSLK